MTAAAAAKLWWEAPYLKLVHQKYGQPITTTLVLSGLALHVTLLCAAQDSLPISLDPYVAGAIRSMDLPGAAIALVKDGRVIVAKGHGVARREP